MCCKDNRIIKPETLALGDAIQYANGEWDTIKSLKVITEPGYHFSSVINGQLYQRDGHTYPHVKMDKKIIAHVNNYNITPVQIEEKGVSIRANKPLQIEDTKNIFDVTHIGDTDINNKFSKVFIDFRK